MIGLRWFFKIPALGALGIFAVSVLASCRSDDHAAVRLIKGRGVALEDQSLIDALTRNDLPLAEALVSLNFGFGARDDNGRTSLMIAAGGRPSFLVPELLLKGSDPRVVDHNGMTPLAHAVENGKLDAIVSLLEAQVSPAGKHGFEGSLVAQALRLDQMAAARLLLDAGANHDARDAEGKSLLRITVEKGQGVSFYDLLERGAKLDEKTRASGDHLQPLSHLALEKGRVEMLTRLLEEGVDPEEVNLNGETLLYAAVKSAQVSLLPLLKKHGASFDVVGPDRWRPVHHAIRAENTEMLKA